MMQAMASSLEPRLADIRSSRRQTAQEIIGTSGLELASQGSFKAKLLIPQDS